jgi:sugar phosphate isomerase/epimerase
MNPARPLLAVLALGLAACAGAPPGASARLPAPGLQLYSLRDQFAADGVPATLDRVRALGFREVELAGTYGMPPEEFRRQLDARGLDPVSGHFPYARWKSEPDAVAREAKLLGLRFAGCAWADHRAPCDEKQCRETLEVFDRAGLACAAAGVRFFYHFHGFEFHPWKDGTLADLLISGSDPGRVSFQMDVLWILFPGQDPVSLFRRHPGHWVSMHLKDLKRGVETGSLAGKTDVRNDVVLGTGQADWPAIFREALAQGVRHYFIEDESPAVLEQIPGHLEYLARFR